jgi:carboxypeptidase family protein
MSRLSDRTTAAIRTMGLLPLTLSFLLSASLAHGQIVNASLYGTVTDPTGAAVPEASVTATNTSTGIATRTTSDPTGAYTLPSLPPGTYSLTVEKAGFKSTVISGISLEVNQQAQVNAQLQVGQVTTAVEITGAAPLVSTSTASVGTVIGEREVVDLPLNLRRFGALAVLVPGTTTDNGGFASQSFGSPFSEASYAANGARSASNNTLIDGADSRNLTFGGFAVSPPPDAVQEFKVQTNIYDAAFGKTAGSTINLVTKSGTNEIHGTVYEFLRNDKLDARNTYATSRPEFRRNQFGFSVGGPIRKNKTFFFGARLPKV